MSSKSGEDPALAVVTEVVDRFLAVFATGARHSGVEFDRWSGAEALFHC
jgi:hypothetical protein